MTNAHRTRAHVALTGFVFLAGCKLHSEGGGSASSSVGGSGGLSTTTSASSSGGAGGASPSSTAITTSGAGGAGGAGGSGGSGGGGAPAGSVLWTRVFQPQSTTLSRFGLGDIGALPTGGAVVIGDFSGDLDLYSGSALSAVVASCYRLSVDDAGNTPSAADFGQIPLYQNTLLDLFACSDLLVSPTGNLVTRRYVPIISSYGNPVSVFEQIGAPSWSVTLTPESNPLTYPRFWDTSTATALSMDLAGNILFARHEQPESFYPTQYYNILTPSGYGAGPYNFITWDQASTQSAFFTATDVNGNIYLGEDLYGTSVVSQLEPAMGYRNWQRSIAVSGLAADASGNIVVVTRFEGTVDFGTGPITSTGAHDFAILKLDSSGVTLSATHFGGPSADVTKLSVRPVGTDGVIMVVETTGGSVDFGDGIPTGPMFIARFDASGALRWHHDVKGASGSFVFTGAASGGAYIASSDASVDLGQGPPLARGRKGIFIAKIAP